MLFDWNAKLYYQILSFNQCVRISNQNVDLFVYLTKLSLINEI